MKKTTQFFIVLLLVAGLGLGIWFWWHSSHTTGKLPALRAVMKDEDEPRPIEPSLALQVNEDKDAIVFAGTPVWFQVNADNANAINDLAGTELLAAKVTRLQAEVAQKKAPPEMLQRATADLQKRRAPSAITLGDASRPWTEAVQFVVRDDKGGEKPLGLALKALGDQRNTVELDTRKTVQANFGVASADLAPGSYSIVACLGATGSWHGRACSAVVNLTVLIRPGKLAPEQQLALDRQKARYGLQAGDYKAIEDYGNKLVAADPSSGPGHIYLGEAALGKDKLDVALREFLTARSLYNQQKANATERPVYLNARINQLLERSEKKK